MKAQKPQKKRIKEVKPRRARCDAAMSRANKKLNPLKIEKIRKKSAPVRNKISLKRRKVVKEERAQMDVPQRQMRYAIETASAHVRAVIRGYTRTRATVRHAYKKKPKALCPPNYDELLQLIPPGQRAKPTRAGQQVVYVLAQADPMPALLTGTVERIARHKVSNWILVRKPWPLRHAENPFLAVHSTNAWLASPHVGGGGPTIALLPNKGLYVIYCAALNEFYVGNANNISLRIEQHKNGKGAAYTKSWHGDFYRVRPINIPLGKYSQSETKEVLAIAMKYFKGRVDTNYIGRESKARVRGGGFSLSQ